ncbi:MAG: YdcH family protein [bacterium]
MEQHSQELETLRKNDPEVDSLLREHRSLDDQVGNLTSKSYLTPDEDMELHRLKKEKLRLKDRLETVLQQAKSA